MDEPRAPLPATHRLRSRGQFQRVFRHGVRLDGALFLVVAAPNEQPWARLGLAAGRRVGGAVRRNRARRLLREAYRLRARPVGIDLVIVAKPELAECRLARVQREFDKRLERLEAIRQRRSPRPAVGD